MGVKKEPGEEGTEAEEEGKTVFKVKLGNVGISKIPKVFKIDFPGKKESIKVSYGTDGNPKSMIIGDDEKDELNGMPGLESEDSD